MAKAKKSKLKLLAPMILSSLFSLALPAPLVGADELDTADINPVDTAETTLVLTDTSNLAQELNEVAVSELDLITDNLETVIEEQDHNTDTSFSQNSVDMSQVPQVWEEGYKGQGMVVAIIDSGLDIDHDVFQLTDVSTAKYKTQEEMETAKTEAGITYGQWYNEKVIFGYNYAESNNNLKQSDPNSHGTHVSSIAVGNGSTSDSYFEGVAPEAQLMFMRVFSDTNGPRPLLYARAIEDAVKLGADVINLSLGSAAGSSLDMSDHILRAIEAATVEGVTVVIAAGNHGVYGQGTELPLADNPDYAVIASPAVARNSIAVASYNNSQLIKEVFNISGMEDNEALNGGAVYFTTHSNSTVSFPEGEAFDYVFAGYGSRSEVRRLDLTGKIALVQRGGGVTFEDKIRYAQRYGAVGVVIFNNVNEEPFTMEVERESLATYPSAFISQAVGQELLKEVGTGKYKIQFNGTMETVSNPQGNQLSDFSSWGLTADGQLKPDVAAPGGSIYAAINDNKYAAADGTSMAAPQVAGILALMKQALAEQLADLTPSQQQERLKQILMSTATPHFNTQTQAYTSPRQQGAGLVDSHKAINSILYLTGDEGLASLTLGNVDDQFDFTVTVHNTSDQDKELIYVVNLTTDEVEDGRFTLKPRALLTIDGQDSIIVPAQGKITLPIRIDSSAFTQELSQQMPNGYYLEGFVRFLNKDSQDDVVSIPFVGFKGEFENLEVIEKPIYDFDLAGGELPFYTEQVNYKVNEEDYTTLLTSIAQWDYQDNQAGKGTTIVAGTYQDDKQDFYLATSTGESTPILLLSPNDDNNRDSVTLRATFLRNYTDLQVSVYRADDIDRQTPVWVSQVLSGTKNYFGDNDSNDKSTILTATKWDGRDLYNLVVDDGPYKYVVNYYSTVSGASQQELAFDVFVDTKAPIITTAHYDEADRLFTPREALAQQSDIYQQGLFYYDDNKERIYIPLKADGSYQLPETKGDGTALALSDFWFEVEDMAGNIASSKLSDLTKYGNETGFIAVNLQDIDRQEIMDTNIRYVIRNEEGQDVTLDTRIGRSSARTHALPFGQYSVELILHDEDKAELVDTRLKEIIITADASRQAVTFDAKPRTYARFSVSFDTTPPAGTQVSITTTDGKTIALQQSRYNPAVFEQQVLTGNYSVSIDLPAGYEATENNFDYLVTSTQRNQVPLSLQSKGNLEENGSATTEEELPTFDFNEDHDGDGYTTADELELGTDPFDKADYPQTAKGNLEENGSATTEEELPAFDFNEDHDGDGFSTAEELGLGTDPFDKADYPQTAKGNLEENGNATSEEELPTFDFNEDHDGDGVTTADEVELGTDPFDKVDYPQTAKGNLEENGRATTEEELPTFDFNEDHDGDGVTTADEVESGTDPFDKADYPQTAKGNLEENGDATSEEELPTFDFNEDHDGDGYTTADEVELGTDPVDKADYPQTAKGNLEENGKATSEEELPTFDFNEDHDGDGFTTAKEVELGTDPFDKADYPQTAKGNLEENGSATTEEELPTFDFNEDHDGDGFTTAEEVELGTDPFDKVDYPQTAKGNLEENGSATTEEELPTFDFNEDHDGDGYTTAEEVELGTDPVDKADYPQTAKGNLEENGSATSEEELPTFDFNEDHDGDGFTTAEELELGTDPFDKDEYPQTSKGNLEENGNITSQKEVVTLDLQANNKMTFLSISHKSEVKHVKYEVPTSQQHTITSLPTTGEKKLTSLFYLGLLLTLVPLITLNKEKFKSA